MSDRWTASPPTYGQLWTLIAIVLLPLFAPNGHVPLYGRVLLVDAQSAPRHVVGAVPGDLVIGALFPVHHAPILKVRSIHVYIRILQCVLWHFVNSCVNLR